MTLLLACLTQQYAIQVSDRRVTDLRTGDLRDDNRNKAVVFMGNHAVCYTGLAEIQRQRTDHWLADVLGEVRHLRSLNQVLRHLAARSSEAFRAFSSSDRARHAFLISGWVKFGGSGSQEPYAATISNALDPNLSWTDRPLPEFQICGMRLSPHGDLLLIPPLGQPMPEVLQQEARGNLQACVRHDTGPTSMVRIMAEAIWKTASVNRRVGRNLMAVSLPSPSIRGRGAGLIVPISSYDLPRNSTAALYIQGVSGRFARYAPDMVGPDLDIRDWMMWSQPPGEIGDSEPQRPPGL